MTHREVWLKRAVAQGIPYGTNYRGSVPVNDDGDLIVDANGDVEFTNAKGGTSKVKATQILFRQPGTG